MKSVYYDIKYYISECKQQDFAFFAVLAYLIFSYLRPQVIYPWLNVIPWTQLVIVAGMVYIFVKGSLRIQKVHVILLIFALVVTASAVNSHYPEQSISKLPIIYIWILEVIFFTCSIKKARQVYLISIALFLILFKISLFGARTWIERGFGFRGWGIVGPEGFFANSGELSLLMAMFAVLSFTFLYATNTTRKIYYIVPATAIMTVIAASSRGGQLALIVGLLAIAFFITKFRAKNIIITILAFFLIFNVLPDQQKERFMSAGEDDTSVSRLLYWEKGLDMMRRHGLLGVGFYAFPRYFQDHYAGTIDSDTSTIERVEVAHNSFIEVGATTGYLGLLCYLWLIFHCYSLNRHTRRIIKSLSNEAKLTWIGVFAVGVNISLLVYLVGSFFMSVAFYPYIYILLMISQSLRNSMDELPNINPPKARL